jgi:hypothetical protein
MFKWKRTPWLAALALGAVMALAAGCGDDDDDDGNGGGGDLEARNGTWNVTVTSTLSGSGEGCTGTEGPFTIPLPLCDIDDPGDISGGGDDEECDVDQDGNDVTFHCTEVMVNGGCTITLHSEGEGTFNETSLTMMVTSWETVSPASEVCLAQADPCTTTSTITATWLNGNGCSGKPTVPAGAVFKRMSRIAGSR